MDMQRVQELIALAERLSFSAVADQFYITQSTLSKHVAAAEREVGFKIFERSTVEVELTEAGGVFVDGLRAVGEAYEAALMSARGVLASSVGTVRIIGPLMNEDIRMLAIEARRSCFDDRGVSVGVSLCDVGLRDPFDELLARRADIAIGYDYAARGVRGGHLCAERLRAVPFGVACHKSHPLATKSPLTFADIVGCRLLTYPVSGRVAYHEFVAHVCRKHGIEPPVEHCDEGVLCVPVTPDQVVFGVYYPGYAQVGDDIVSRPLDEDDDVFGLCLMCLRDAVPAVRNLFDGMVKAVQSVKK